MYARVFIFSVALLGALQAQAVVKCTSANGAMVLQDRPCEACQTIPTDRPRGATATQVGERQVMTPAELSRALNAQTDAVLKARAEESAGRATAAAIDRTEREPPTIAVGMTGLEVQSRWDSPSRVIETVVAGRSATQWVYHQGRYETQYVYLRGGVDTSISTAR